jgi:hypothetical protein
MKDESESLGMTLTDKTLVVLLRIFGVTALFALGAVVMPTSWMTATHRWLGLGEMPTAPIVGYLARSLSAFYALFGALCLLLSADLGRYRPLIRHLGVLIVLMGFISIGIDMWEAMPSWWTAQEGPPAIVFGGLIFVLARPRG